MDGELTMPDGGITAAIITVMGTATLAGAIAKFVSLVVISAVAGKLLAPSFDPSSLNTGYKDTIKEGVLPRRVVYGQRAVSGPIVFVETNGVANKHLNLVIAVTTHPVEDITHIMLDDDVIRISGYTIFDFDGYGNNAYRDGKVSFELLGPEKSDLEPVPACRVMPYGYITPGSPVGSPESYTTLPFSTRKAWAWPVPSTNASWGDSGDSKVYGRGFLYGSQYYASRGVGSVSPVPPYGSGNKDASDFTYDGRTLHRIPLQIHKCNGWATASSRYIPDMGVLENDKYFTEDVKSSKRISTHLKHTEIAFGGADALNELGLVPFEDRGGVFAVTDEPAGRLPYRLGGGPKKEDSSWGRFHKLTDCSYVHIKIKYDMEGKYPNRTSLPKIKFIVKGKRVYDPTDDNKTPYFLGRTFNCRTQYKLQPLQGQEADGQQRFDNPYTWKWSENWALCVLDYLVDKKYGVGARTNGPPVIDSSPYSTSEILEEVDWDSFATSIIDSDELVESGLGNFVPESWNPIGYEEAQRVNFPASSDSTNKVVFVLGIRENSQSDWDYSQTKQLFREIPNTIISGEGARDALELDNLDWSQSRSVVGFTLYRPATLSLNTLKPDISQIVYNFDTDSVTNLPVGWSLTPNASIFQVQLASYVVVAKNGLTGTATSSYATFTRILKKPTDYKHYRLLVRNISSVEAVRSPGKSGAIATLPNTLSPNLDGKIPRYTVNAVIETNQTPISIMETLLGAGAGYLTYSQGTYSLYTGKYRPPVAANAIITDNDLTETGLRITTGPSRSNVFNKAGGVYLRAVTPHEDYATWEELYGYPSFEPADFPLVDPQDENGVSLYELEDGEEIIKDFDFPYTTNEFTAQRIARIQLEKARNGLVIEGEFNLSILRFSVGDTVYFVSDFMNWGYNFPNFGMDPNYNHPELIVDSSRTYRKTGSYTGGDLPWSIPAVLSTTNPFTGSTINLAREYSRSGEGVDIVIFDYEPVHAGSAELLDDDSNSRVFRVNWEDYTDISLNLSNSDSGGHGHSAAVLAAGRLSSFAPKAHIYPLINPTLSNIEKCFEAIKNWHLQKGNNRPTIISMSLAASAGGIPINTVQGGVFRGEPWTRDGRTDAQLKSAYGLNAVSGDRIDSWDNALQELEDIGIHSIVICPWNISAAEPQYYSKPGHEDWDNVVYAVPETPIYCHRGSSPCANNTIRTGGIDTNETKWSRSPAGPGVDIYSPSVNIITENSPNNYSINQGTSWTAPVVASVLANILEWQPQATPRQARNLLFEKGATYGRLQSSSGGFSVNTSTWGGEDRYLYYPEFISGQGPKQFVITSMQLTEELTIRAVLMEESALFYDWNKGMAFKDDIAPNSMLTSADFRQPLPPTFDIPFFNQDIVSSAIVRDADNTARVETYLRWSYAYPNEIQEYVGVDRDALPFSIARIFDSLDDVDAFDIEYGVIISPDAEELSDQVETWIYWGRYSVVDPNTSFSNPFPTPQGPIILRLDNKANLIYQFRIRSISTLGTRGGWVYFTDSQYAQNTGYANGFIPYKDIDAPPAPAGLATFSAVGSESITIQIDANNNSEVDMSHFNIYASKTFPLDINSPETEKITVNTPDNFAILDAKYLTLEWIPPDNDTWYFWVSSVDTTGNESGTFPPASEIDPNGLVSGKLNRILYYFIRSPRGTVIKNSDPEKTLRLEAYQMTIDGEEPVVDANVNLYIYEGISAINKGKIWDNITAADIGTDRVVFLRNQSTDEIYTTISIIVVDDGTSVNIVFRRAETQPATPSVSLTVPPAGWYNDITAVPGEEGTIWSSVGIFSPVLQNWTWQLPIALEGIPGEEGEQGEQGEQGLSTKLLILYLRNPTEPLRPVNSAYIPSTNTFSDALGGGANPTTSANKPPGYIPWSLAIPEGGDPLWVSYGNAQYLEGSSAIRIATDQDSMTEIDQGYWTDPAIIVEDGEDGEDGTSVAEVLVFRRAASQPATPSTGSFNFSNGVITPPADWSTSIPSGNLPVWMSFAVVRTEILNATVNITTWSSPALVFQDGDDGVSSIQLTIYRRQGTTPTTPSGGSYNFDTRSLTAPSGWSYTAPEGDDILWASSTIASIQGPSGVDSSLTWTAPSKILEQPTSLYVESELYTEFFTAPIPTIFIRTSSGDWTNDIGNSAFQGIGEVRFKDTRDNSVLARYSAVITANQTTGTFTTGPTLVDSLNSSRFSVITYGLNTNTITVKVIYSHDGLYGEGELVYRIVIDGATGADGASGQAVNIIYKRAETQPDTPDPSSGVPDDPVVWYDLVEDVPSGIGPIWASVGKRTDPEANWVWDEPFQIEGKDGSGVNIKGSVLTVADLDDIIDPDEGDAYIIDDDDPFTGHLFVWNGTSWIDAGQIRGPQGAQGPQGPQGDKGDKGDNAIALDSSAWVIPSTTPMGPWVRAGGAGGIGVAPRYITLHDQTPFGIPSTAMRHTGDATAFKPRLILNQTAANFDGGTGNGTYSAGEGYAVGNTITLSSGAIITVNTVSSGEVTGFTVTNIGITPGIDVTGMSATATLWSPNPTLTQTSTSGSGTGFDLTVGINNRAMFQDWYARAEGTFDVDPRFSYMFTMYIKRRTADTNVGLYVGYTSTGTGNDAGARVRNLSDNSINYNPYLFSNQGINIATEAGKWYLLVGIVHAAGTTAASTGIAGIYDVDTGHKLSQSASEFRFKDGAVENILFRYGFYKSNTSNRWFTTDDGFDYISPVVYVVNGDEPSVRDLVKSKIEIFPTTLPNTGNYEGRIGFNNGKLWRYTSGSWTAEISGQDITDESIIAGKLAANSIVADNISVGAVIAAKIDANAVTTVKLDANAVTTNKLAARAITADKIKIAPAYGSSLNIDPSTSTVDAYFSSASALTPIAQDILGGGLYAITTASAGLSTSPTAFEVYRIPADNVDLYYVLTEDIPIDPLKTYKYTLQFKKTTETWGEFTIDGDVPLAPVVSFRGAATELSANTTNFLNTGLDTGAGSWFSTSTEYAQIQDFQDPPESAEKLTFLFGPKGQGNININARRMRVGFVTKRPATSGFVQVQGLKVEELVDDSLIVDGSITTDKLNALAVTAEKIDVDAVTTTKIAADAVTAEKIDVVNLAAVSTSTGTLTADLIRTAASGERLEISKDGDYPIWFGSGTKNAANAKFYTTINGDAVFKGNLVSPTLTPSANIAPFTFVNSFGNPVLMNTSVYAAWDSTNINGLTSFSGLNSESFSPDIISIYHPAINTNENQIYTRLLNPQQIFYFSVGFVTVRMGGGPFTDAVSVMVRPYYRVDGGDWAPLSTLRRQVTLSGPSSIFSGYGSDVDIPMFSTVRRSSTNWEIIDFRLGVEIFQHISGTPGLIIPHLCSWGITIPNNGLNSPFIHSI